MIFKHFDIYNNNNNNNNNKMSVELKFCGNTYALCINYSTSSSWDNRIKETESSSEDELRHLLRNNNLTKNKDVLIFNNKNETIKITIMLNKCFVERIAYYHTNSVLGALFCKVDKKTMDFLTSL